MMKSIIKIFEGLYNKTKVPYEEPFLSIDYQLHNIARLKHLDTLALDLHNKTVIEFGAGIGDHTYYYLLKNCRVISTDARIELVNHIAKRFGNETMLINIETDIDKIKITLLRYFISYQQSRRIFKIVKRKRFFVIIGNMCFK
jgi:16S rRNA A1518/A1519 N6-dimethyltransferase RsmA/KsgA/DIM1 with predicted DNA glycosylase/AP lyase activity